MLLSRLSILSFWMILVTYQITWKIHSYTLICKCRLCFLHLSSCSPKYLKNVISQISDLENHMMVNLSCLRFNLCLLSLGLAWVSSLILLLLSSLMSCFGDIKILLSLFQPCFATFFSFKSYWFRLLDCYALEYKILYFFSNVNLNGLKK